MNDFPGRLIFGYRVSAGMITDQWRNFGVFLDREYRNVAEYVSSSEFSGPEKVAKLLEFSATVRRNADFMASLCLLLLPLEPEKCEINEVMK
ncbi:MAG: hypothetical protein IJD43_08280 [Thermoguttaceae bacterium]|nr:hypothetical protein [Thermoguttaceae bacterium]